MEKRFLCAYCGRDKVLRRDEYECDTCLEGGKWKAYICYLLRSFACKVGLHDNCYCKFINGFGTGSIWEHTCMTCGKIKITRFNVTRAYLSNPYIYYIRIRNWYRNKFVYKINRN